MSSRETGLRDVCGRITAPVSVTGTHNEARYQERRRVPSLRSSLAFFYDTKNFIDANCEFVEIKKKKK